MSSWKVINAQLSKLKFKRTTMDSVVTGVHLSGTGVSVPVNEVPCGLVELQPMRRLVQVCLSEPETINGIWTIILNWHGKPSRQTIEAMKD